MPSCIVAFGDDDATREWRVVVTSTCVRVYGVCVSWAAGIVCWCGVQLPLPLEVVSIKIIEWVSVLSDGCGTGDNSQQCYYISQETSTHMKDASNTFSKQN